MVDYIHKDLSDNNIGLPIGKVICVGRNYLSHIKELNNEVPEQTVLFMKPSTALCFIESPILIPKELGECHNELEVAILIKNKMTKVNIEQAKAAIWGVGVGLDLTLRDVQSDLKNKGLPWERAKAFDGSCPISRFIPLEVVGDLTKIEFSLKVNGMVRQSGYTTDMMLSILELLVEVSCHFTLLPGDIVMSGTPKGVGPIEQGDLLGIELNGLFNVNTEII